MGSGTHCKKGDLDKQFQIIYEEVTPIYTFNNKLWKPTDLCFFQLKNFHWCQSDKQKLVPHKFAFLHIYVRYMWYTRG